MTGWITSLLVAASLCAAPALAQDPIVVGAVVSRTGAHAKAASGYRKGLILWQEQANASGGLLGRQVELRLRDDASQAVRAGREYEALVAQGVDLLVGPYGSAATLMATAVAERAKRVMINGAGPARAVHQRAPHYVFQSGVPYASYGAGVLELAKAEGLSAIFLLARDDPRSRDMAEATAELARMQGIAKPQVRMYAPGTAEFSSLIEAARAARAEAWIAFGEAREAVEMVRAFKALDYAPKLFYASATPEREFVELLGQYAEYGLGAVEYDRALRTPGNEAFVKAFSARWTEPPGSAAAHGYAAGTVLAAALASAGSLETEKVRAALVKLEIDTVLGTYQVDARTGAQTGLKPAVSQILFGRPAIVWPATLRTAEAALPYPAWNERTYLK